MAPLSKESLELICDAVLVRSIATVRHALDVMRREGLPAGNCHVREMKRSLMLMLEEARRRDLNVWEDRSPKHRYLDGLRTCFDYKLR